MRSRVFLASLACMVLVGACNTTGQQADGPEGETVTPQEVLADNPATEDRHDRDEEARGPMNLALTDGEGREAPAAEAAAAPGTGTSLMAQGALDYRLNPLDVIEISVFQVPDLSTTAPINATGMVSLPLLGVVPAAGKTTAEFERDLERKYGERYLQSPQVTVFVKEYNSQRVTVYGAVDSQGMRTVQGRTTLMQVIAQSGGLTRVADPSGVMIFRDIDGERHGALFDMRPIEKGQAPDPEIKAGDIVVVDESAVRSTWRDVREVIGGVGSFRALGFLF